MTPGIANLLLQLLNESLADHAMGGADKPDDLMDILDAYYDVRQQLGALAALDEAEDQAMAAAHHD